MIFNKTYLALKSRANQLTKEEKLYVSIVSIVFLCYSIYHILFYPVYVDESQTFIDFTSKGILSSTTEYPYPNNHIFFSILTNLTYHFPFDPLINLRIPNLLIGLTSSLLVYYVVRSLYNHRIAIIPHLFFTFSYFLTFYSVFARGYMSVIFVTIVCFACIEKLKKSFQLKYVWIYSIASIIGFYVLPTFLYVFVSFILYLIVLFIKQKETIKVLFIVHLLITLIVLLLYTPIIYYNGLDAIINNQWTKKLTFQEIIDYFRTNAIGIYDRILGVKSIYFMILYLVGLLLCYKMIKKEEGKNRIIFIFIFFIMPLFYILIHQVIPGPRTWSYLIFPFSIGITILIEQIFIKKIFSNFILYVVGVGVILIQVIIFHKSHPKAALDNDYRASELAIKLQEKKFTTYFFEPGSASSYEEVTIRFQNLRTKKTIQISNELLDKENIEKIDCFFLKKDSPLRFKIENRTLVYENSVISVFSRKKD